MLHSHRTNLTVKAALGVILVVLFVSVVNMQLRLQDLRKERNELSEQVDQLMDEIEETNYRLAETASIDEEYVERYAREKLGYYMPDEIIFKNEVPD